MNYKPRIMNGQGGFAALLTVIILAAALLIIALSASIIGLGDLEQGYTSQKGGHAFAIADGCMEETFRRIRLDSNYGVGAGNIALTLSNGSCIITVADLGSGQRRIVSKGTIDSTYNKKIQSTITLSGTTITVNAWEEVAE